MTDEPLAELRRLAEAATPGPWGCFQAGWRFDETLRGDGPINGVASTRASHSIAATFTGAAFGFDGELREARDRQAEQDAEYIAACDPATVLSLLDEIVRLRMLLREAASTIDRVSRDPDTDEIMERCVRAAKGEPC